MRITVFNGSPHAEKGNTHLIVEAFLAGAEEAGAQVENIFLAQKDIRHCIGCSSCWLKTPGRCVLQDDMGELLERYVKSDVVGFATPIYSYTVTGFMKDFLDRLIPLLDPHFEKDERGICRHLKRLERYPKYVVISNCGFPEKNTFQALSLLFKRIARSMHTEVIAEIYKSGGEFLQRSSLIAKPLRSMAKEAGREVVKRGRLSRKTRLALEKSVISDEQYIEISNRNWDEQLEGDRERSLQQAGKSE